MSSYGVKQTRLKKSVRQNKYLLLILELYCNMNWLGFSIVEKSYNNYRHARSEDALKALFSTPNGAGSS